MPRRLFSQLFQGYEGLDCERMFIDPDFRNAFRKQKAFVGEVWTNEKMLCISDKNEKGMPKNTNLYSQTF